MYFPYTIAQSVHHWEITLPDFPQSSSRVPRANEPKEAAEHLLLTAIQGAINARERIPFHDTPSHDRVIGVSALVAMKIRLSNCMLNKVVTKGELAHRIGGDQTKVDRILDPTHNSQLETMEEAYAALGFRVEFTDDETYAPRKLPYFERAGDKQKTFAAKNMWVEEIRKNDQVHLLSVHRKNKFVGFLRIPDRRYKLSTANVPSDVADSNYTLTGNERVLVSTDGARTQLTAEQALVAFDHDTGMLD